MITRDSVSSLEVRFSAVIHARRKAGIITSDKAWSLAAGLSNGYVKQQRYRARADSAYRLPEDGAAALARVAQVRAEWLRFGTGPMSDGAGAVVSDSGSRPVFVYATVTQASGDAWRVEGTADDRTLPTMAAALSHAGAQGFRLVSANGTHSEFVMERAALERASGTGTHAHARGDVCPGEDPGAPSNAATTATATEKESC